MSDFETTYKDLLSKKYRDEKGQYATGGRRETRLEGDEARELWDVAFEAGRAEVLEVIKAEKERYRSVSAHSVKQGSSSPPLAVIHAGALAMLLQKLTETAEDTSSLEQGEE